MRILRDPHKHITFSERCVIYTRIYIVDGGKNAKEERCIGYSCVVDGTQHKDAGYATRIKRWPPRCPPTPRLISHKRVDQLRQVRATAWVRINFMCLLPPSLHCIVVGTVDWGGCKTWERDARPCDQFPPGAHVKEGG